LGTRDHHTLGQISGVANAKPSALFHHQKQQSGLMNVSMVPPQ
jgi:hypothetical protein